MRPICICFVLLFFVHTVFAAESETMADKIFSQTKVQGGFVVHLGCGDGTLTTTLRQSEAFQVHGLTRSLADLNAARQHVLKSGNYGDVAVDLLTGDQLPYVDNLVNLLVVEEESGISSEEMQRVLVPNGVAYVKTGNGQWIKTSKAWPDNIDEWSHYLHDASGNAVAHDDVVAQPRHLQWVGSPRWSRHHDRMASMSALVSTNGRMFYVMDEGKSSFDSIASQMEVNRP